MSSNYMGIQYTLNSIKINLNKYYFNLKINLISISIYKHYKGKSYEM